MNIINLHDFGLAFCKLSLISTIASIVPYAIYLITRLDCFYDIGIGLFLLGTFCLIICWISIIIDSRQK